MFSHYFNLILDKIFDLALTVVVIDRLLAWRERRRWKHVRIFVELQLEAALGDTLRAWSTWLTDLRKGGKKVVLSKDAYALLKDNNISTTTSLPPEDFESFVQLCAGEPMPVTGEKSFVDIANPNNFRKELLGYLVHVYLDGSNIGWTTLIKNLQSLVPRLAELVERLPKEKIGNDEIGYRQLTEEMSLLIRKIDPVLYDREVWDDEFARLDRMKDIARSIGGIILLIRLFRASRRV
jgi:hypothetical protein